MIGRQSRRLFESGPLLGWLGGFVGVETVEQLRQLLGFLRGPASRRGGLFDGRGVLLCRPILPFACRVGAIVAGAPPLGA
jgi:hypothetical protein